jgi:hypothetical protein
LETKAELNMIILSQTYHVTGQVKRGEYQDPPEVIPAVSLSYEHRTPNSPAADEVSIPAPRTPDGVIFAKSTAKQSESGPSVSFHTEAYATRFGPGGGWPANVEKDAFASLDVRFKLTGPPDQQFAATLAGDPMYSDGQGTLAGGGDSWVLYDGPPDSPDHTWRSDPIALTTDVEYTLSMSVRPVGGEGGSYRTLKISAGPTDDASPVIDAGTTLGSS